MANTSMTGIADRRLSPPLHELSMAVLTSPLALRDGSVLPVGTRGVVVFVYADGAAYEVEFDEPFRAVVTVEAVDLREAAPA